MSKTENLFKNINMDNLDSISEIDFLSNFLVGNEFYHDFIYLKKEMPDLINSLNLDGEWVDSNKEYHLKDKHYYLFGKIEKNAKNTLIYGEVGFENNKIKYFRYSPDASFIRKSFLINYNGNKYFGTNPLFDKIIYRNFNSFSDELKKFNIDFSYSFDRLQIDFQVNGKKPTTIFSVYFDSDECSIATIDEYDVSVRRNAVDTLSNFCKINCKKLINNTNDINIYLNIFEKFIDVYNNMYI